jgi:hypothetical protein
MCLLTFDFPWNFLAELGVVLLLFWKKLQDLA